MKFTVLIENSGMEPFQSEHGLSILIEYDNEQYLLDAGTTDLFLENAKIMNAPIDKVRTCFLSHGHYDHSGGFGTYLSENENASVYMMKDATDEYYSGSGGIHPIGIPREIVDKHESRFRYVDNIFEFQNGIYLIPHVTKGLSKIGERAKLYRMQDGQLSPDEFSHEMSLVFDTDRGLVIFNSCSHGGVPNIIQEVKSALPEKHINAFVGGFHLKGDVYTEEEIAKLAAKLKQEDVDTFYTGHCTGEPAMSILESNMRGKIKKLYTGLTVEI